MRANTVRPFAFTAASSLFIVSRGPWSFAIVVNPAVAIGCPFACNAGEFCPRNGAALRRGIARTPNRPRYILYIARPWRCTREWRRGVPSRPGAGNARRLSMQLHWWAGAMRQGAGQDAQHGTHGAVERPLVHHAQRLVHDPGKQALDEDAAPEQEAHQVADRAPLAK